MGWSRTLCQACRLGKMHRALDAIPGSALFTEAYQAAGKQEQLHQDRM